MTPRRHFVLAVLFAVIVPSASWALGSGSLAYRMYARSGSYRIRATVFDAAGRGQPVSPTAIAARARGTARHYLAGADHWLTFPRIDFLSEHLADVARLACATELGVARARIELFRRRAFDGPIETRSAEVSCP